MTSLNQVKREIKSLENRKGEVTAEAIFNYAKTKTTSALHGYLKDKEVWDKEKAQHHYGVTVCRELLRRVKVVETVEEYTVTFKTPQYVRNPDAAFNKQSYVNVEVLRKDKNRLRHALVPYVQRALASLTTASYLSEETGCSDTITHALEVLANVLDEVSEEEVVTKKRDVEKKREREAA